MAILAPTFNNTNSQQMQLAKLGTQFGASPNLVSEIVNDNELYRIATNSLVAERLSGKGMSVSERQQADQLLNQLKSAGITLSPGGRGVSPAAQVRAYINNKISTTPEYARVAPLVDQVSRQNAAASQGGFLNSLGNLIMDNAPAIIAGAGMAGAAGLLGGSSGGVTGGMSGAMAAPGSAAEVIGAMGGAGGGVSGAMEALAAQGASLSAGAGGTLANAATGLGYDALGTAATGLGVTGGVSAATQSILQQAAQQGIPQEVIQQAATNPSVLQQVDKKIVNGGGGADAAQSSGLLSGLGVNNALGIAATLGASALGGTAGGSGNMATTTTQEIPNQYVQQYLPDYLSRASTLSNKPYEAYAGKQVADFTPYQTQALDLIANRAASNPLYDTGYQTLQDTASGKYLDPNTNPYLQGVIDKSLGDVRSMMGSTFGANNFGSSAHEEMLQRKAIEAISPILMQNYQQERGNQLNASMQAPQYSAAGYNDANQLLQAGNMQQGQQQNMLTSNYNDWLRQQEYPYQSLGVLGGAVNVAGKGGSSGTTNAPNPYAKNSLASGLGMAATTAGLANQMGLFGTPATATAPATQASPWAWPLVIGGGLLGSMG